MNRKPVIQSLSAWPKRTIVISDIHGSLDIYQALLKKCHYIPGQDRLILLGDLMEKGNQNLALLRFLMKQAKEKEVYMIMGNCDFVAKNVLFSYRLEFLRHVLTWRKNSLIHEMIQELGLPPLTEKTDMHELAATLRKHYLAELSFLNDLPHVLVHPKAIFAHAGISDEISYGKDFKEIMARHLFDEEDHYFSKPVIVGHMPAPEYCHQIASFNPYLDFKKNIFSIDGGNAVKHAGQLNALIFENDQLDQESLRWTSVDTLPKVEVTHTTHPKNPSPIYITWCKGEAELLENHEKSVLVNLYSYHQQVEVDKAFFRDNRASSFTTYEMPLKKGEKVSLVNTWDDKAQIKKDGILGWTHLSNLQVDQSLLVALDLT